MAASDIVVKGAREHNLRSVDLVLPRNRLICLTGVSGSGKSSFAFDTLYAEGQRRYIESLSSFARQFLGQMPKPDVDHIDGLSPSISISQKSSGQNPRSTVGTITEIYDYLRVLYARAGQGHCPRCGEPITAQTREQILGRIERLPSGTKFSVLAPVSRAQKGEFRDLFEDLLKQGFVRARVDGSVVRLGDDLGLDRRMRHDIEVVVDRLTAGPKMRGRLAEAVDLALKVGDGSLIIAPEIEDKPSDEEPNGAKRKRKRAASPDDIQLSAHYACVPCGMSFDPPTPQMFSFNSPQGMCPSCDGLGELYTFDPGQLVPDPSRSLAQGCIETISRWRDLGRWRRHIYQGVAETLERRHELEPGTLLETAWEEIAPDLQRALLWGTGDLHITYSWRHGGGVHKYGGTFDGVIPELLSKYRNSNSRIQRRQLEKYMRVLQCDPCHGARLNDQARAVKLITGHTRFCDQPAMSLPEVCGLAVSDAADFFSQLDLDDTRQFIAAELLKEIRGRLGFLSNVGLNYLTLDRKAPTLSGGESQRIRLAGQIGCGLVGVLYILDEPSIGLHARDNARLLDTLAHLRDQGNTVVVVEHDEDTMRAADQIIDFGPGPGVRGGEVVATGPLREIVRQERSVTGQFLDGRRRIEVPTSRRPPNGKTLKIVAACHNNLKEVDVEIPLGTFTCITGVSGSGKSSLVNGILVEALRRDLNGGLGNPGDHKRIDGLQQLDKLIAIDQSPIGRTPRSNPATYIKVFDEIRRLYAQLPDAKARGYKPGRFSFNVSGGRCEACDGNGSNRLNMDFLADVWVTCPVCEAHRFNRETLQVKFKGASISDVLEMDIQQALTHFENIPKIHDKLQTLHDVGLDYLKLGQPSPTLSGGEAQRIKLARELVKRSTGKTLYLLDEPTTGLHFADISMLLKVLHDFVDAGNTVLVVEHNLDVAKTADWIIDLGPEGGAGGGHIVAAGTPEEVARTKQSFTGQSLAPLVGVKQPHRQRGTNGHVRPASQHVGQHTAIKVRGASQHNLKNIDVDIPRDAMTVCCGPSGSGKSSLAMDTVYAEGQRRYVESLSSYARQFVGQMQKPKLEHIEGLSPAIAIEQKHLGHTPRSTVGTVTEIYDYFRILFARLGTPHCPDCDRQIGTQSADEVIDKVMAEPNGTRLYVMAPLEIQVGERYEALWDEMRAAGYVRIRVDRQTHSVDDPPQIDRRRRHLVEVIVDRVKVGAKSRSRIADSVQSALALGKGVLHLARPVDDMPESKWAEKTHSQHFACDACGRSFEPITPHSFSFNSSLGWCETCEGLGTQLGADLNALLNDPKLTLAEGAVALWPGVNQPLFEAMLKALSKQAGVPADVPFDQLGTRARRIVLHGTGNEWIDVFPPGKRKRDARLLFRFQYKGLYPALEEASRLSAGFRAKIDHLIDDTECPNCAGSRLREESSSVRFRARTLDEVCRMPLGKLMSDLKRWKLDARERQIAGELLREITNRVRFLLDVGLEYLTLGRAAPTLSGGEAQRIRLASQVGSGLTGVLYVLDEPTIGLHPRDNRRLLSALTQLRDLGNTLLIVEHDREVVQGADRLLDFGPASGIRGGEIVAQGTAAQIGRKRGSVTGPYLTGKKAIPVPTNRRLSADTPVEWLEVIGARHHNLRDVHARFPLGALTVVTGVSGSGKSSLVEEVLYNALARILHRAQTVPGAHEAIHGLEHVNKVIRVDQQSLGHTPTSNPATYTGVFELIRSLFAQLPESKMRGYSPRRFSFNVPGGRCEKCEGAGQLCIEMHFLPDVWVDCDECRGARYNPETLTVRYRDHSIADVLQLPCGRAADLFVNIPKIRRILETLCDVGLDYVCLGQPAPTLSGGEAQRVKLAAELSRPDTGKTLYLLDEPTTGLHFEDLAKLLEVLNRLVDLGNTMVVIEHNLDVIKTADWVIDMGPEAGEGGGKIVVAGTPEDVVAHAKQAGKPRSKRAMRCYTGEVLEPVLAAGPHVQRAAYDFAAAESRRSGDLEITQVGREAQMPWQADGRGWHTRDRLARNGNPCRWEGQALARVVDRIHELGDFARTNWGHRSIVEISAPKKSDGWFMHAITGEEWLLKMKFRTAKRSFDRDALIAALNLKPLNELPEIPVYGSQPRTECKNLRGPWQEVQLKVHWLDEIDRPEFWQFLEQAVAGFKRITERAHQNPDEIMPWKVLGRKWHLARKGFPLGKRVRWEADILQQLFDLLSSVAPGGDFIWTNQQVVHLSLSTGDEPWATVRTKRVEAVELALNGPKGQFALGRVAELGRARKVQNDRPDKDIIKLRFREAADLSRGDLSKFLAEHREAVLAAGESETASTAAGARAD